MTAYELAQRGYKNIRIVAEFYDSLTSHHAGGLFAQVSMLNSKKSQPKINKIGCESYQFYQAIAQKKHHVFKEGAKIMPAYFEHKEDSGLEFLWTKL